MKRKWVMNLSRTSCQKNMVCTAGSTESKCRYAPRTHRKRIRKCIPRCDILNGHLRKRSIWRTHEHRRTHGRTSTEFENGYESLTEFKQWKPLLNPIVSLLRWFLSILKIRWTRCLSVSAFVRPCFTIDSRPAVRRGSSSLIRWTLLYTWYAVDSSDS